MSHTSGGRKTRSSEFVIPENPNPKRVRSATMKPTTIASPAKRATKKETAIKSNLQDIKQLINIPTQNRYNIDDVVTLEDLQHDEEMSELRLGVASSSKENATGKSVGGQERQKKVIVPPIVIYESNISDVQNAMNTAVTSKKFELENMTIGIKVHLTDMADFEAARSYLKGKFNFWNYHSTSTRPRKIVLYGLYDMPIEEIKEYLAEQGVIPTDVKKLMLKSPQYTGQALYLLYFEANTVNISDLRKLKSICHVKVRWEYYKPKAYDQVPQCRNCQMLGHSSVNCNMPARCLVCAGNHNFDGCTHRIQKAQLPENPDRSYIKCSNCAGNHTANYRGCRSRTEYIELQKKIQARRSPRNKVSGFAFRNQEFPDLQDHNRGSSSKAHNQPNLDWRSTVVNNSISNNPIRDDSLTSMFSQMMQSMNAMMNQMSAMMELLVRVLSKSP